MRQWVIQLKYEAENDQTANDIQGLLKNLAQQSLSLWNVIWSQQMCSTDAFWLNWPSMTNQPALSGQEQT